MAAPRRALDALLDPKSVAVIGASPDFAKPGGRCLAFLEKFGYRGTVYPINPKYEAIGELRCYPSLAALPGPADLVVLIVGAESIVDYMRACGAAGARAAIVCSSGFAEGGEKGERLQEALVEAAREGGVAVLGPNCLGLVDLHHGLVASFSMALDGDFSPRPGPIAFVSQSGAMGIAVFALAQQQGIGVGKFVSTGNEAVLDFTDFLEHLCDDPDVTLILGYLEGVRDGRRFVTAARRARAAGKRIAVLKVGLSDAGGRAARSHTGALAGSAAVYDAAFRRAGVNTVTEVSTLLDLAVAMTGAPGRPGNRVGIVSMSGGAAVMMADKCSLRGLEVAPLGEDTRAALAKVLPPYVSRDNPVDYGPVYLDAKAIEACVDATAADASIDLLLVFLGLTAGPEGGGIEQRLADVQARHGKRIVVAWFGGPKPSIARLRELGVAAYDDPGRAVDVAAQLARASAPLPVLGVEDGGAGADDAETRDDGGAPDVCGGQDDCAAKHDSAAKHGSAVKHDSAASARRSATREAIGAWFLDERSTLTEREVKRVLAPYGVPMVPETPVTSADAARRAALAFGRPVALKAEAPALLHKTDAGAVRLNVAPEDAGRAYDAVVAAAACAVGAGGVAGALVQPMAREGVEILVGARFDPQFGPAITVGLGGVASEVLADVVTELAPLDRALAGSMIDRLRGARLLGAFRGAPARDREALIDVLVAVSAFAMDAGPLLAELDLNPVIVHEQGAGCTVVDGAAVLDSP